MEQCYCSTRTFRCPTYLPEAMIEDPRASFEFNGNVGSIGSGVGFTSSVTKGGINQWKNSGWQTELPHISQAEILQNLTGFNQTRNRLLNYINSWRPSRQLSINRVLEIADKCDRLHENCNIANVTGDCVGLVGGLLTLVGLGLVPVTFGTSLSLRALGTASSLLGAGVSVGSAATESYQMQEMCASAQQCLDVDQRNTQVIAELMDQLRVYVAFLRSVQDKLQRVAKIEFWSCALTGVSGLSKTVSSISDICRTGKALEYVQSLSKAELELLEKCPDLLKHIKVLENTVLNGKSVCSGRSCKVSLGYSQYFSGHSQWLTDASRKTT